MHSKGALSGNLPQRSFVILTYGFFPRCLQRYQLSQPRFIRTANLPQHMRRIPIRCGMIDKAERRGHHIRKRRPLRVIRHRADALVRHGDYDGAIAAGAMNCMECGSCTFACPAKRELTQSCRVAKAIARTKAKKS